MTRIRLDQRFVGDGQPCFIVAEIGINHNGNLDIARQPDRRGRRRPAATP